VSERLGDSTSEPALDPRPPERPPPRSLRSVLAVAGGLALLLTIVVAASRGGRVAPAGGGGASDTVRDYFLSTYLVVGVIVFVAIVYLLARERETLPTRRSKHRDIRQLVQLFVVVIALLVAGRYIWNALHPDRGRDGRNPASQTTANGSRRQEEPRARRPDARFRWEPLIALGALGLVAAAAVAGTRARRREEVGDGGMADALASVLDDALADLRAERDLRRAIIAAYARMERLLAAHDVPRRPSEAPFEYLGRVLLELDTSANAVFELTALFERAKFSRHTVDEGMRDEAIAALAAVRDELRGST